MLKELAKQLKNLEYLSNKDQTLVLKALKFAKKAHFGQKRMSGEPYLTHALAVAQELAKYKMDSATICAGLLHDVSGDTKYRTGDIQKEFNKEIAFLVNGVTKLDRVRFSKSLFGLGKKHRHHLARWERQAETLRKMALAMAKDIRVVIIKLADRQHNCRTLKFLPPRRQLRIAMETLEIYAPLAERLGMNETKGVLEDLSFPFVLPDEYKKLTLRVKDAYKKRQRYVNRAIRIIKSRLAREKIWYWKLEGRAKHFYSLYRKLQKPKYRNDLALIYDLVAVRIITRDIADCYRIMGLIHSFWKPMPGLIKDYIATPKPNGYRSLHTTVFGPDGKALEIQIRTKAMHEQAEFGVAAHWHYSQAKKTKSYLFGKGQSVPKNELAWLKELAKWQKKIKNPREFQQSLKTDFFKNRIFVFTPRGDPVDLPIKATPVDFAYAIHTELGNSTIGAKVDNKIVPLDSQLHSGCVVEIIANKAKKKPNLGWLKFVKTQSAKHRIRRAGRQKKIVPFIKKLKKFRRQSKKHS